MKKILIFITGLLLGWAMNVNGQDPVSNTIVNADFEAVATGHTDAAGAVWATSNGANNTEGILFPWVIQNDLTFGSDIVYIDGQGPADNTETKHKLYTSTVVRNIVDPWRGARYALTFKWFNETSVNIIDPADDAKNATIRIRLYRSSDDGATFDNGIVIWGHNNETILENTTSGAWTDYTEYTDGTVADGTVFDTEIPLEQYLGNNTVTDFYLEFEYEVTDNVFGYFGFDDVQIVETTYPYFEAATSTVYEEDFDNGLLYPNIFWEQEDGTGNQSASNWYNSGTEIRIDGDPVDQVQFKELTATIGRVVPVPWYGSNSFLEFQWWNDMTDNNNANTDIIVEVSTDGTTWNKVWDQKDRTIIEETTFGGINWDEYEDGTNTGPYNARIKLNDVDKLYNNTADKIYVKFSYEGQASGSFIFDEFKISEVEIPTIDYSEDFDVVAIVPNWEAEDHADNESDVNWNYSPADATFTTQHLRINADADPTLKQYKHLTATVSREIPDPWLGGNFKLSFDWANEITKNKDGADPITHPGADIYIEVRTSSDLGATPANWSTWTKVWDVKDSTLLVNTTPGFNYENYLANGDNVLYSSTINLNDYLNNDTKNQIQVRFVYNGTNAGYFAIDNFEIAEELNSQFELIIKHPTVYTAIPIKQLADNYVMEVEVVNNGMDTFDSELVRGFINGGNYSNALPFGYNEVEAADFIGTVYPKSSLYTMQSASADRAIEFEQVAAYEFTATSPLAANADALTVNITNNKFSRAFYANMTTDNLNADGGDIAGFGSMFKLEKDDIFTGIRAGFGVADARFRWSLVKLASETATTGEVIYQSVSANTKKLNTPTTDAEWNKAELEEEDFIALEAGYYMIYVSQQSVTPFELRRDDNAEGVYFQGKPTAFTKVEGEGNVFLEMLLKQNKAPEIEHQTATNDFLLTVGVPFSYQFMLTDEDGDAITMVTDGDNENFLNLTPWLDFDWLTVDYDDVSGLVTISGVPESVDEKISIQIGGNDGIEETVETFTFDIMDYTTFTVDPLTELYNDVKEDFATNPIGTRGWNIAWDKYNSDKHWAFDANEYIIISSSDSAQVEELYSPSLILPVIEAGDRIYLSFDWQTKYTKNGGPINFADVKVDVYNASTQAKVATIWSDDDEETILESSFEQGDETAIIEEWPYDDDQWYTSRFEITDWAQDSIYLAFTYTDNTEAKAADFLLDNLLIEVDEAKVDLSLTMVNEEDEEVDLLTFGLPYTSIPAWQMNATSNSISASIANLEAKLAENALLDIKITVDTTGLVAQPDNVFYESAEFINVPGLGTYPITLDPITTDVPSVWKVTVTATHDDDIDNTNDTDNISFTVSEDVLAKHDGVTAPYAGGVAVEDGETSYGLSFDIFADDVLQKFKVHFQTPAAGQKLFFTLIKDGSVVFNTKEYLTNNAAEQEFELEKPYNISAGTYTLLITPVGATTFMVAHDAEGELVRGTVNNQYIDEEFNNEEGADLMVDIILRNDAPNYKPAPSVELDGKMIAAQIPFNYTFGAIDKNGHDIEFDGLNLPTWLSLTDNQDGTATISGTPLVSDLGNNFVEVWVSDGRDSIADSFVIIVIDNPEPYFTTEPITTATQGVAYSYTAKAEDRYDDNITLSVVYSPTWLTATVSGDEVELAGTPVENAHVGANYVKIKVVDEFGYDAYQTYTITVMPNAIPVFVSAPTIHGKVGEPYVYNVLAKDDNPNDVLTITMLADKNDDGSKADWLTLVDNGGGRAELSGIPTEAGEFAVTLVVTDAVGAQSEQTFTAVVQALNIAPEFISAPVTDAVENSTYSYTIEATDSDGDALTFSLNAPSWLVLTNIGNGKAYLRGTPVAANVGDNNVTVTVSDGELTAEQVFTIVVTEAEAANAAPTFTSTPTTDGETGKEYQYLVEAFDENGDAITFNISAPTWLSFTDYKDGSGLLYGTPESYNKGSNEIVIYASDGKTQSAQSYVIDIVEKSTSSTNEADFNLYPNPAIEQIHVETVENATIRVYDMLGRSVFETISTSNLTSIDVRSLPSGVYVVKVTSAEGETISKRVNIKK